MKGFADQSLTYSVLFKKSRRMPWNVQYFPSRLLAVRFADILRDTTPFMVILDSEGNTMPLPLDTGE